MKTIKTFISVLLIFCIASSISITSFAYDANSALEDIKETFNEALETEEPTEPVTPEPDENEIVARMYACTKIVIFGHAWIYIENTSNETIKVGVLDVAPGEGASVGTYGISRSEGSGLYYNVEAYRINGKVLGMSMNLTRSQLNTVNEKITNRNKWNFFGNCVAFTAIVWNSVSKNKIVPLVLPLFTTIKLAVYGSRFQMIKPDRHNVYKQVGTGSSATLKEVADQTVNHFIG